MKKSFMNIHHTAIYAKDDVAEQFDIVNESHRKRWNGKTKSGFGFYGGYHYLIERSGKVQQFRDDNETGAHNSSNLMNYRALGICFAGNMSKQELTSEQIQAAVRLIEKKQLDYNIPDKNIKPHRYYKSTQCPGNNIPDRVWDYLRGQDDKLVNKTTPDIVKWHKKNKIIEFWNSPPTEDELKLGWSIYKALKVSSGSKLKFDL